MRTRVGLLVLLLSLVSWQASAAGSGVQTVDITVVQKDTLYNLCKKYLDDPEQWRRVARINRLVNPDLIHPGQLVKIPADLLKGTPVNGIVTFVTGDVTSRGGEKEAWRPLRMNDSVKEGCTVRTGNDGAVEIASADGVTFLLRPDSIIQVKSGRKTLSFYLRSLYLQTGRILSNIKAATGREPRYEIRTPSSVAAARGTDYRVSLDTRNDMRSEVLEGTVDVAAMGRKVVVGAGEGAVVKMNEPPSRPRKLLPPPGPAELDPLCREMPLLLHFQQVPGAASYRIMLARDREARDIVREKVIAPGELVSIIGVDDGLYYLRSLSIDADGLEGPPSVPQDVKIRINPLPPFIEAPLQNARLRQRSVGIKWLKVQDAVRYHLQIAEDRDFGKIVADRNDLTAMSYSTGELENRTYWFRVKSIAADGYEGLWSVVQRFDVSPPPPVPPVDTPETTGKEITLRWRDLGKGITYQVQMADDELFSTIISDNKVDNPEITLAKPGKAGTYYVRVRGIDAEGYSGNFSMPQSFVIESPLLPVLGVLGGIWSVALILLFAL